MSIRIPLLPLGHPLGSQGGAGAPQQLGSSSQAAMVGQGGAGGSGIITSTSGWLSQHFGSLSLGSPLTQEENNELENLKRVHEYKIKEAKLVEFKKVPSHVRQMVVDALMWQDTASAIGATVVSKDSRLQELENKKALNNNQVTVSHQGWMSPYLIGSFPIPEGLTAEDLKRAHLEATVEEEVLDGEES